MRRRHLQNVEASPPSAGLYWKGRREEARKHERRLYGPFPVAPRCGVWCVFARRIVVNLLMESEPKLKARLKCDGVAFRHRKLQRFLK